MPENFSQPIDERFILEVQAVERLGKLVGFGNMMSIASALWRLQLQQSNTPITGAFVPINILDISEDIYPGIHLEMDRMDQLVKKALQPTTA